MVWRRTVAATAALGICYFVAIVVALVSTRFDGGVASVWIAGAILTARLTTQRPDQWASSLLTCGIAACIGIAWFGFGPGAALPLAVANLGEAVVAALLLHRFVGPRPALDSHRWLVTFILSAGIAGPAFGAAIAGTTVALMFDQPFGRNALRWYAGHAMGTIAFMPIVLLIVRGDLRRIIVRTGRKRLTEHAILIAMVAATSALTFAQDGLPLLFLPLLPITLATFRGGPLVTAGSILALGVIGLVLTLAGHGPLMLMQTTTGARMQVLQLYIAATMLTVLPATAELQRRAELFARLRESEARYRMLADHSTDIVLNLDTDARIAFVSPSIRDIGGFEPDELIGRPIADLLDPADLSRHLTAFTRTLADPDHVSVNEYRVRTNAGMPRWMEARSRAVMGPDGRVAGMVSVVRDVTDRRAAERHLAAAAMTDPLTGLANRRAFEQALADAGDGCLVLFDLDHFKRVNDRHGHVAGDIVLRRFAAIATAAVREGDMVARIGGEEFAILLRGVSVEQAVEIGDRLRAEVAEAWVPVDNVMVNVTVSGGIATIANDATATLRAADGALYRAKLAGRDRLAIAA